MTRDQLKHMAREIGFDAAGIAPVALLSEEVRELEHWVSGGKNAGMGYMARNMEVRENPERLVEGARSVIVTLTGYYTAEKYREEVPRIAMYARGKDYHIVVKERLFALLKRIQQEEKGVAGRCFVDSAPVLEHAWAKRAGLGWQGKNTLLIRRGLGSYCFIGVIVSTLEPEEYDRPFTGSFCGTCNRCVEACPTGALVPGELDARKCISYHTIENKGDYPEEIRKAAGNRIFGCDICQEVCPWNQKLPEHRIAEFRQNPEVASLTAQDWKTMESRRFKALFKDTPLERTGLSRILRNL